MRLRALEPCTWKAHEIGANAETRTLACRSPDARGYYIQDGKHRRRHHTQRQDLIPRQAMTGHKDRSYRNKQTLYQVFDGPIHYLGGGVHTFYICFIDFSPAVAACRGGRISEGIRLPRISV